MFSATDVTLCVPAHKSTALLRHVLDGIASLHYPPARVVVIDDGSSPPISVEGVEIIRHDKNYGLANSRNTALADCDTALIAFLDSDVVADPRWLETLLYTINETHAAGVGGRLIEAFSDGLGNQWRCRHMVQHWGDTLVRNPRFLYGANCLYVADVLRAQGGFDVRFRTHDEDRSIGGILRDAGHLMVYQPAARCFHQKKNTWQDVLYDYWGWHYSQGLIQGDYDSPEGLFRRIEIVHFGLSRYRLHLDAAEDARRFRFLDAMIPFVFLGRDLQLLHERTQLPLPVFHHDSAWLRNLPALAQTCFMQLCPKISEGEKMPWHDELMKEFDRCLHQTDWIEAADMMSADVGQYYMSTASNDG